MTREQARREIDSLDFYLQNHTDDYGEESHTAMMMAIEALSSAENPNKWIPITSRPMTEEEKEDFAERTGYDEKDFDDILSCPLPEDGETVLITDRLGNVEVDTFINDCDGCYFECNCDMEDVKAWMPLPQPYQSEIPTGQIVANGELYPGEFDDPLAEEGSDKECMKNI